METAERVCSSLPGDVYFDLSVRHFHEKLREEHVIELSYTVGEDVERAVLLAPRKLGSRRGRPGKPFLHHTTFAACARLCHQAEENSSRFNSC
jgi:hypothetical protein